MRNLGGQEEEEEESIQNRTRAGRVSQRGGNSTLSCNVSFLQRKLERHAQPSIW